MALPRPAFDPDLYERDFYVWTQVQGAALRLGSGRDRAAGCRQD